MVCGVDVCEGTGSGISAERGPNRVRWRCQDQNFVECSAVFSVSAHTKSEADGGGDVSGRRLAASSGAAVIVAQQSAEAFTAVEDALRASDFVSRVDHLVVETLVIAFVMVVSLKFG